MIGSAEIDARAARLGLLPVHVWKDYVLCHLLAATADAELGLAFRGGTALARAYWPDFRLSEDLDFIAPSRVQALGDRLQAIVATAGRTSGLPLRLVETSRRDGRTRGTVAWAEGSILLDVSEHEPAYIPVQERPLLLPYSDLASPRRTIAVVALEEILGNKWYMLDDRAEPRDLFDLWTGLCRFAVPFDDIARGFRAKYGQDPGVWRLRRAERLAGAWEARLTHQVANLPPFEDVYEEVRAKVEDSQGA